MKCLIKALAKEEKVLGDEYVDKALATADEFEQTFKN